MTSLTPEQLVPSYEQCKKLGAKEWNTNYVWAGQQLVSRDSELVEGGIGGPPVTYPAPMAEELLKSFNKLKEVKAPELRYDMQIHKWQVWWENPKTHYMEHAEPSESIVEAAYNAYIQVKED